MLKGFSRSGLKSENCLPPEFYPSNGYNKEILILDGNIFQLELK